MKLFKGAKLLSYRETKWQVKQCYQGKQHTPQVFISISVRSKQICLFPVAKTKTNDIKTQPVLPSMQLLPPSCLLEKVPIPHLKQGSWERKPGQTSMVPCQEMCPKQRLLVWSQLLRRPSKVAPFPELAGDPSKEQQPGKNERIAGTRLWSPPCCCAAPPPCSGCSPKGKIQRESAMSKWGTAQSQDLYQQLNSLLSCQPDVWQQG